MPKLKQPGNLGSLAIGSLCSHIYKLGKTTIESNGKLIISENALHRFILPDLPSHLSCWISANLLMTLNSMVNNFETPMLTSEGNLNSHSKTTIKNMVKAFLCPQISELDMLIFHTFIVQTLIENLSMFKKIRTLIIAAPFPEDVEKNLTENLKQLKFVFSSTALKTYFRAKR